MKSRRFGIVVAAALLAVFAGPPAAALSSDPPKPKLVVVIAVDQFGTELFEQYRARFSGGLRRMADEGVVFANGYQSHAATETCPGHSTMLTGRHPAATGIVANSWYNRASGTSLYCVLDPSHPVPGRENQGRGPVNLKASTFGEWLKQADPRSRVFGVSGKDRAAIMMTGHNPDGVFWWDDERGFTTSVPAGTSEIDRLAPIADFNADLFARWRKMPPAWSVAEPRCAALNGSHRYGRLTIDHHVPPDGWTAEPGQDFTRDPVLKKWFRASPSLDAITLDLAASLVDRFRLGQGEATDFVAVSLSATDYVGHRYGNQGPEMCDNLAHLDRALGAFLDRIAALRVPVVVALTADHGAVDASERVSDRAMPAVRIEPERMVSEVGNVIKAELGLDFAPLTGDGQQITITTWEDDPALRKRIGEAAIAALRKRPEVEQVFTAAEIASAMSPQGKPADELTLAERLAESYDAQRSGDIIVAFKPYASFGDPETPGDAVAGHGSPWNYDRRVPILFWWPGAAPFEQSLPVETVDIAPTLAAVAGVAIPQVDGRCLDLNRGAGTSCPSAR